MSIAIGQTAADPEFCVSQQEEFGMESCNYCGSMLLNQFLAVVMLIFAVPVIVLLLGVSRLSSRGPGLYRQRRVGLLGKVYWLYKIRSMRLDAEAASGPVWTSKNDPRVTRFGQFVRVTHLDELPQLWNVVRGEMALVGPRPERPELVARLIDHVPGYLGRLKVTPGITGLAQINLPPDVDMDSVRRKLVLDMEYVRTRSVFLDLRIVLSTALHLFRMPQLLANRLLGLDRRSLLELENASDIVSDKTTPSGYTPRPSHQAAA